jgi:hypothetical protein
MHYCQQVIIANRRGIVSHVQRVYHAVVYFRKDKMGWLAGEVRLRALGWPQKDAKDMAPAFASRFVKCVQATVNRD